MLSSASLRSLFLPYRASLSCTNSTGNRVILPICVHYTYQLAFGNQILNFHIVLDVDLALLDLKLCYLGLQVKVLLREAVLLSHV